MRTPLSTLGGGQVNQAAFWMQFFLSYLTDWINNAKTGYLLKTLRCQALFRELKPLMDYITTYFFYVPAPIQPPLVAHFINVCRKDYFSNKGAVWSAIFVYRPGKLRQS
jgi:hypothetical protein